jgi:hypothetical protein
MVNSQYLLSCDLNNFYKNLFYDLWKHHMNTLFYLIPQVIFTILISCLFSTNDNKAFNHHMDFMAI